MLTHTRSFRQHNRDTWHCVVRSRTTKLTWARLETASAATQTPLRLSPQFLALYVRVHVRLARAAHNSTYEGPSVHLRILLHEQLRIFSWSKVWSICWSHVRDLDIYFFVNTWMHQLIQEWNILVHFIENTNIGQAWIWNGILYNGYVPNIILEAQECESWVLHTQNMHNVFFT